MSVRRPSVEHSPLRRPGHAPTGRTKARAAVATAAACVGVALLAAACSDPGTGAGTSAAATPATTGAPARTGAPSANHGSSTQGPTEADVRTMQQSLREVGCYRGAVDGIAGPQTTTAVRSFQSGSHLAVDGVYGHATEAALTSAVRSGRQVCAAQTTTTTTASSAPKTASTRPSAPSTTSPTAHSTVAAAPCTAAAIGQAVPSGDKVISYQCGGGWAAGSWTNSDYAAAFLLQSSNGRWVKAPANACQNAAVLGIPSNVLDVSPCKVS